MVESGVSNFVIALLQYEKMDAVTVDVNVFADCPFEFHSLPLQEFTWSRSVRERSIYF